MNLCITSFITETTFQEVFFKLALVFFIFIGQKFFEEKWLKSHLFNNECIYEIQFLRRLFLIQKKIKYAKAFDGKGK